MEPSFNIQSDNSSTPQQHLLAEAGPQGLSLICTDMDTNTVTACVVYHFASGKNAGELAAQLQQIFADAPLLRYTYKKTDFVYAFNQAILAPHDIYKSVSISDMLDGVFGDAEDTVLKTDFVYRQHLHNMYRIPAAVHAVVNAAFPAAGFTHQYSLLADAYAEEGNRLHAIFYTGSLTVLLRKEGKLQVIQQFAYDTPETAAWHLLNTCRGFGAEVADTALVLHGMIDNQSALYAELYKYFQQPEFAALPEGLHYSSEVAAVPHHFFSHLFAMKLCV